MITRKRGCTFQLPVHGKASRYTCTPTHMCACAHMKTLHKHVHTYTLHHTHENGKTNNYQWLHQKPCFLSFPPLTRPTGPTQVLFLIFTPCLHSVSRELLIVARQGELVPHQLGVSVPASHRYLPCFPRHQNTAQATPSDRLPWLSISSHFCLFSYLTGWIQDHFSALVDFLPLCFQWLTPVSQEQY